MQSGEREKRKITIDEAKKEITNEVYLQLVNIDVILTSLLLSLTNQSPNSIREVHLALISEQESMRLRKQSPNPNLIEQLKQELMTVTVPQYTTMLSEFSIDLPSKITTFLAQGDINLKQLPDELLQNVGDYIAQDLANQPNLDKNKFKWAYWLDKVKIIKETLRHLLEK